MKRTFSRKQRRHLAILSGFKCEACRIKLTPSFHGDHVRPHSRGGSTTLRNGQALCNKCNLIKGVSDHDYRNTPSS